MQIKNEDMKMRYKGKPGWDDRYGNTIIILGMTNVRADERLYEWN